MHVSLVMGSGTVLCVVTCQAIKTARSHPLRPVKKEDEEEPLQQTFELHEKHLEPGYHVGTVATLGEVTIEMDTVQGKVAVVNSDEEEVVIVEKGGVSAQDKHSGVASSDEEEVILEKKSSMEDVLPSPLPLPPPPPTVEEEDEEAVNKG